MKKNVSKTGIIISSIMAVAGLSAATVGSIAGLIMGLAVAPIVCLWAIAPAIENMVR